jgi:hypothetical protein
VPERLTAVLTTTDHFRVVADHAPVVPGHTLIMPNAHFACYGAVPAEWVIVMEEWMRERGVPMCTEQGVRSMIRTKLVRQGIIAACALLFSAGLLGMSATPALAQSAAPTAQAPTSKAIQPNLCIDNPQTHTYYCCNKGYNYTCCNLKAKSNACGHGYGGGCMYNNCGYGGCGYGNMRPYSTLCCIDGYPVQGYAYPDVPSSRATTGNAVNGAWMQGCGFGYGGGCFHPYGGYTADRNNGCCYQDATRPRTQAGH